MNIDNIIKIENEVDIKIKYVNIGGGIGIPYKLDEKSVDLEELVDNIYNIFSYYINGNSRYNVI